MTTARRRRSKSQTQSKGDTDYRPELWRVAEDDVLALGVGLIGLKYISDAFEERRAQVLAEWGEEAAEDRDEYVVEVIFWVQHFLHRVAPRGVAGFVLANGSMSSGQSGETKTYADIPGFCKTTTLEDIRKHGHVLTPGRYVGAAPREDDGEPVADKMARLSAQWREQQAEARRLDAEIEASLKRLGLGVGE